MNSPQSYIAISIVALAVVVLAVVAVLVFVVQKDKTRNRLTPLAGLAFAFAVAGICFGRVRPVAYILFGIGIALAVVDTIARARRR